MPHIVNGIQEGLKLLQLERHSGFLYWFQHVLHIPDVMLKRRREYDYVVNVDHGGFSMNGR